MVTNFALGSTRIHDQLFYFDGNGKITLDGGSFDKPTPNSFSLVQVTDCPFSTPLCQKHCYVHRLEDAEREVHDRYKSNSAAIRHAIENHLYDTVVSFANWIRENAAHGFRWHVSGDIFSEDYARFIREVCLLAPKVPFWIYTRSFPYLEQIHDVPNLEINLSADMFNYDSARVAQQQYGSRICYMTVGGEVPRLPKGSVVFPSHQLRGRDLSDPTEAAWWRGLSKSQRRMVCPPDFFGQSEKMRCGPCRKCLWS